MNGCDSTIATSDIGRSSYKLKASRREPYGKSPSKSTSIPCGSGHDTSDAIRNELPTFWILNKQLQNWCVVLLGVLLLLQNVGCNLFPDVRHQPQYHNPFPQIQTVAILPFRNQSDEPTLDAERVTHGYYDAMQSLPGFEVLPVGLVQSQLTAYEQNVLRHPVANTEDLQKFASHLGVDVVLQGAITDYEAYYPPRMALKVNWYAANPGFHPIPPGYGLPWGTKAEKKIPQSIRLEAERSLAREQIDTQTPILQAVAEPLSKPTSQTTDGVNPRPEHHLDLEVLRATKKNELQAIQKAKATSKSSIALASASQNQNRLQNNSEVENVEPRLIEPEYEPQIDSQTNRSSQSLLSPSPMEPLLLEEPALSDELMQLESGDYQSEAETVAELPTRWPDPQGFIPSPPKSVRPTATAQSDPIIRLRVTYRVRW